MCISAHSINTVSKQLIMQHLFKTLAWMMTPHVDIQLVWHQCHRFYTVTGIGWCLTQTDSELQTEPHMPADVWKTNSQECLWDHSPRVEKLCLSSVTHFVIVWGNERIKKWGREDPGISTDKWERSSLPVRRPNFSTTSSLLRMILRPCSFVVAITVRVLRVQVILEPPKAWIFCESSSMLLFLLSHTSRVTSLVAVSVCRFVFFFSLVKCLKNC